MENKDLLKVVVVYYIKPTFVVKDIEILSQFSAVSEYYFNPNKLLLPFSLIKQLFYVILNLKHIDVFVCQIGGYHCIFPALLSKWFSKKCYIITVGADCVSYPTLGYGNLRKKILRFFSGIGYKNCTAILPVHKALANYTNNYYKEDIINQGIENFYKTVAPVIPLENGYDTNFWKPDYTKRSKKLKFISVCGGLDLDYRKILKGADIIVELAKIFPEYDFVVVGGNANTFKTTLPTNITIIPTVKQADLLAYYQSSHFYIQLSISEGFPNALAEAMACGCVPIVSNVSSMPNIIGDTGFVLTDREIAKATTLLKMAVNSDILTLSNKASERIQTVYPQNKRTQEFKTILKS